MDHFLQKIGWKCPVVWIAGLVVAVSLSLTGCTSIDKYRGDGFQDNTMSDTVRESQPAPKKPHEFWSFSNKARQIESDFPDG